MNFLTVLQMCFRKSFVFRGRAPRSEFWYWMLFVVAGTLLFTYLDAMVFKTPFLGKINNPMTALFGWITLPAFLSASWRRLHDIGRSGWWIGAQMLWLIFTLCVAVVLYVLVVDAKAAGNTEFIEILKPYKSWIETFALISFWSLPLGGLLLLVFFCMPSKAGENAFGPNPKTGLAEVFGAIKQKGSVEYKSRPAHNFGT